MTKAPEAKVPPKGPLSDDGLSPRHREVLKDVIRTFIASGEPVSSRAVAKTHAEGLSSATIRNVMADLEEVGLLRQPHTSAGRVPTRRAYHLYIDSLMGPSSVSARERRYIRESLEPADSERLMGTASHLLSELSHQIGIVMTPAVGETVLRAVDLVPLMGSRVLCVVVSATGFVDNKVIDTGCRMGREELIRISNYLTRHFGGLTLREIRSRILELMSEERAKMDRLLANAILVAGQALRDGPDPNLLVEGTSAMLRLPELADVERVRRLLDTFSDKAALVTILNQLIDGRGVRVLIGDDSNVTSDLDFSLVATRYGVGDRTLGTLGIFGPSRMEYQRVVPLVHYLGDAVSRALELVYDEGDMNDRGQG